LREYRALLREYRALLREYRALWREYRALRDVKYFQHDYVFDVTSQIKPHYPPPYVCVTRQISPTPLGEIFIFSDNMSDVRRVIFYSDIILIFYLIFY